MKTPICYLLISGLLMTAAVSANAEVKPNSKIRPTKTVLLYPEGQGVDKGITEDGKTVTLGPGVSNGLSGNEIINEYGNLSNVNDSARIDIYLPKKCNGQMVVVCPGGGYEYVSSFNEGVYVADWLVKQGVAACVVKYRLPNRHYTVPLTDVQNAFRYCRAHADDWGIRQIGIIGFSAGGHLAASASTLFVDDVTRPDFSILIYPVIDMDLSLTHKGTHNRLIGKEGDWLNKNLSYKEYMANKAKYDELMEHYTLYKQITPNTPPTMLALSTDDTTVPAMNSVLYYESLLKNKVPAQMYIYPYGNHGWGFTTSEFGTDRLKSYRAEFFSELKLFLKEQKTF